MRAFVMMIVCVIAIAAAEVRADNYSSIVRVETPIVNSNTVWSGTGFFVKENIVLTCRHIIVAPDRDPMKPIMVSINGKKFETEIISMDMKHDLALLKVSRAHGLPLPICDVMIAGDRILMNYFDNDGHIQGRRGRVKMVYVDKIRQGDLATNLHVKHGDSGSPVYNNMCVVGMVRRVDGYLTGAHNMVLFLMRNGVVPK